MARKPHYLAARKEFAELLDGHLKRGQHPDTAQGRWKPWTNNDFAGACEVSPNTVANWRNPMAPIPPDDIYPVLDALFADKSEYAGHSRALKEAWERAKGLVRQAIESDGAGDWEHTANSHSALAEVILHPPTPMNQPETYALNATIRFTQTEQSDGDRAVLITLREAFIAILSSGYQTAQNSLLGEGDKSRPNVRVGVGGITITPHEGDHLQGTLIGDTPLALIEPGHGDNKAVTVSVCAGNRAFNLMFAPDPDRPPIPSTQKPNRDAILNLLMGEAMRRDNQQRIILAVASLRRKPQE